MSLGLAYPPRLADGVELLGELRDSGFEKPPALIRRADGQMIQLSLLLYLVACRIDGTRALDAIATLVSGDLGRPLSARQVSYLITAKLAPLGVLVREPGDQADQAELPTANPLLTLRARATLLPVAAANVAGAFFRPLFHWPVIVTVVAGVGAMDYWLFLVHGLSGAFRQVLGDPANLLVVAALSVASAVFHECGHAAGCRYGGARPGRIGFGVYLVWPSFFTDVTDSYRLGRAGRLRTDLGGLYFNAIFMLALLGCYAGTGNQVVLLTIAITHLEMLEQLLPFVRFDGYFILSDLIGVPDLFARVTPVLGTMFTRGRHTRVSALRPPARRMIIAWVLCVIPVLAFAIGSLLLYFPAFNRSLWLSVANAGHLVARDIVGRRYAAAILDAIGGALAALSSAGSVYAAIGLTRRAVRIGRRWTAGRLRRRLITVAVAIAVAASLAVFWTVHGQFRGWLSRCSCPRPPANRIGRTSIAVPAGRSPWPAGIGHHASARASWLTELAPRLAGMAGRRPSGPSGPSVTSTQSSTSAGEDQSRSSRARMRPGSGRSAAGARPLIAPSMGAANSSKMTAAARGYPGRPITGTIPDWSSAG
jgi:putative peptide zinc metalloprotease protein